MNVTTHAPDSCGCPLDMLSELSTFTATDALATARSEFLVFRHETPRKSIMRLG